MDKMPGLKIEVDSGRVKTQINGAEVGHEVTKLVFTADLSDRSNTVKYSLNLEGSATIEFEEKETVFSPFVKRITEAYFNAVTPK